MSVCVRTKLAPKMALLFIFLPLQDNIQRNSMMATSKIGGGDPTIPSLHISRSSVSSIPVTPLSPGIVGERLPVSPDLEGQNLNKPFPLSPQSLQADPVHDLPVELLQLGWRRFWSKRENRPYYFNKLTNESLWEPPQIGLVS